MFVCVCSVMIDFKPMIPGPRIVHVIVRLCCYLINLSVSSAPPGLVTGLREPGQCRRNPSQEGKIYRETLGYWYIWEIYIYNYTDTYTQRWLCETKDIVCLHAWGNLHEYTGLKDSTWTVECTSYYLLWLVAVEVVRRDDAALATCAGSLQTFSLSLVSPSSQPALSHLQSDWW